MKIITFSANKGGTGKSQLTKNTAFALSKIGLKIVVIDMDNQNNLTDGYSDDNPFDFVELPKTLESLKQFKQNANQEYDFCIIDTPPNLGVETIATYIISNYIIIPTLLALNSILGVQRTLETINDTKKYNPNLKVLGILVNNYDRRDKSTDTAINSLKNSFGEDLFQSIIKVSSNIKNADDNKMTVQKYETGFWSKKSTQDFDNLAKEILSKIKKM